MQKRAKSDGFHFPNIVPKDEIVIDYELHITAEQVDAYLKEHNLDPSKTAVAMFPYLIGYITYNLSFPNEARHLGFIYSVLMTSDNYTGAAFGMTIFQDIPREHLVLRFYPLSGGIISD
jgi:hypothetical protein